MAKEKDLRKHKVVERIQAGVRIEKRILKVLKGFAAYHEITVGDLIEGICLHAFEGKTPFNKKNLEKIIEIKRVYGLKLTAADSHQLIEEE